MENSYMKHCDVTQRTTSPIQLHNSSHNSSCSSCASSTCLNPRVSGESGRSCWVGVTAYLLILTIKISDRKSFITGFNKGRQSPEPWGSMGESDRLCSRLPAIRRISRGTLSSSKLLVKWLQGYKYNFMPSDKKPRYHSSIRNDPIAMPRKMVV
jgi:hypothetical protein